MQNMSDQFYNYLSDKIFDYFSKNNLVKGERYYIQFDEESQIQKLYDSIKRYGVENGVYDDFYFQHEKGDEYKTFSINCNGVKFVIVECATISENYLVTLRNEVPKQESVWKDTALFAIFDESIDSNLDAMGNLADKGKPLNIVYISEKLEDEIKKSKNLEKAHKEIIKFSINKLKEDIFQTTIWDYKNILSIIKSEIITSEDLKELGLFPDDSLERYNAQKMQSRLNDNHMLFDEIENYRKYGDVEEELKKRYSDKGVKKLVADDWYLNQYKDVKDYRKKGVKVPLIYEENFDKITPEGLTYWEKPLTSTKAGSRKRQIIVFNDKNVNNVSFKFSFDQRIDSKFLLKASNCVTRCVGQNLNVKFDIYPTEPTFKQIVYKHNDENNSHYIFNILVLNCAPEVFDSIKSRYSINYRKKELVITNDEESDDVIFGIGKSRSEYEIEDKNEKIFLYDEESILISEASPAWEEGFITFELVYNDNSLSIMINEKSKKPVPKKSSVIWNLKRQNKENFVYNGGKAIQGVNSVNLYPAFKDYLDLERQIIEHNIFYGRKEDKKIKKEPVEYSEELTTAYNNIINYYKTYDDTPEDNLPSLMYLNEDLRELYEKFLDVFNNEVNKIQENDVLADLEYKKDLVKLGRIDENNKIMYSSLSPINIAYQLEINKECAGEELSNNLAERLVSNNLIPYLYSDSDELYRSTHQEDAHEWLVYEKNVDVSIGTTNAFISKVVSEKLNQFVKHFAYLFEINPTAPIKINLINIKDDIEIVKGVFSFIRDRLPDKVKTKSIIPVEINIYNDSNKSSFESLYNCDSKEKFDEIFGIKNELKSKLFDEVDVLHIVQNNISYYHNSLDSELEYAHISFYKVNSAVDTVSENMNKMETGISLNGLISTVASTKKPSDYRTGFGTKNILNNENSLIKSTKNINELIENSQKHGKNTYSKNKSLVTSITLDDDNIERLYAKSHWVTFIEPPFGIEYFDNTDDNLIIIHYSDQYTSSNKYDTITVTNKSPQYEEAIMRFLREKEIEISSVELNTIIRMFNSINGEWLLKIVSSSGEYDREKFSIIAAVKYALALFDHEDIIWIPISLEEILRITRNLKLDKAKGPISVFVKQGSYSDDLLLIGLKINNEDNLELMYHPIEVKIGLNESSVIKKGKKQLKETYNLLYKLLNDNSCEFVNKFFRNFFIELFLSNQQKLAVNEIWEEKDFQRIEKFKSKLLNDEYIINYGLEEFIGKSSLFSFKSKCDFQSIEYDENIQIIELPEDFAFDCLAKPLHELYSDIQSGDMDFPVEDLLSQVDLEQIEVKTHPNDEEDSDDESNDDITKDDDSENPNGEYDEDLDDDVDEEDEGWDDTGDLDENADDENQDTNESDSNDNEEDQVSTNTPEDDKNQENDLNTETQTDTTNGEVIDVTNTIPEEQRDSGDLNVKVDLENVRGLIGTSEGSTHEVYWEFGSSQINNRHLLIQGASGYGKSYFIQKMLQELSQQGIPSIIIDYTDGFKKSKLEPEFKNSMANKLEQHYVFSNKFPLNPFKRYSVEIDDDEFIPEDEVLVATRFKDVINSVYKFGNQQQPAIYNAALDGIRRYGDDMDLTKFKEELMRRDTPEAKSALNKITQLLDINPFKSEDFDWSCLDEMDGKIRIIQLTGISKDIQMVITEFVLRDLWNYKKNSGDEKHPFIVVLDEAQNLDFSSNDAPCNKILKEGRKFGWSGWFATQFLKGSMKTEEINTLENASEKIYFHPTDNSISDIASNLTKDSSEKKYWEQKLTKLNKGQCIVHGHLKDNFGEIHPANPVCVDVASIKFEPTNNIPEQDSATNLTEQEIPSKQEENEDSQNGITDDSKKDDEKNTKFIKKIGQKYMIYKTINAETKFYGSFDNLDDAMKKRDELVADNWGLDFDDIPLPGRKGKYGKHIIFHEGVFKINKFLEGKQRYIGTFKTVEEAIKYRDLLIENDWDLDILPENFLSDKRLHNIRKIKDRYIVLNVENGDKQYYGSFDTYEGAKEYYEYLVENNWKVPDTSEEKVDEFVYYIDGDYVVRNEIDGEMQIFGIFNEIGEAIDFRNKCVMKNWEF